MNLGESIAILSLLLDCFVAGYTFGKDFIHKNNRQQAATVTVIFIITD